MTTGGARRDEPSRRDERSRDDERSGEGGRAQSDEERPTVLHLRSSGGIFGADRVVLDLCRGLSRHRLRPVLVPLIEPDGAGEELAREARALGIEVDPLPLGARHAVAGAVVGLRRRARAAHAAIVHGHDYKSDLLMLAARGPWRRVATLHGRVGTSRMLRLKEAVDARITRRFDRVICVSQAMAARETVPGRPAPAVIPNGIDLRPFAAVDAAAVAAARAELGIPERKLVIGAIGRLSDEKGYDLLFYAAARLQQAGVDFALLVVGEGPQRGVLRTLAGSLGMSERLTLPGVRRDTPRLYALLDIFCMPSRREGLPLALLEAMASARAVVTTAVGGIPEVIGGAADGAAEVAVVVPPENPEALAAAIGGLAADPERRAELGRAARERVASAFSAERMTAAVADLYHELLGGRHGTGRPSAGERDRLRGHGRPDEPGAEVTR